MSDEVVETTEKYYDSDDADRFYAAVWGGEDIHVGIYEGEDSIFDASRRTVRRMAEVVPLEPGMQVVDLGAGYGGAARYLAKAKGVHVACLNLSETQNARNRELTSAAGLGSQIGVHHGNFEELPFEDERFDVAWSQDAILHSGRRAKVLAEVWRVLKPGGHLVFTDPMQADDCPDGVLQPVLDRIHLASLASFGFYRAEAKKLGFEEHQVQVLTPQLRTHYASVREELESRRGELEDVVSPAYVERMLTGLGHWVDAADAGYLAWGILAFRKP